MFGLMRPAKSCGQNQSQRRANRLHYCGTCKVIGSQYGHQNRLLLNYDAVFLSELLSLIADEDSQLWTYSLQAVNQCFTMPQKADNLPLSLQYAAAANLFFAELKLDDNIRDKGKKRYKFARFFLSKSFKKAEKQLQNWGLDTEFFWEQVAIQNRLEQSENNDFEHLEQLLTHFAAPTAAMTERIFSQAALVLNQADLCNLLAQIGAEFGRLTYILDAFEDLETDIFNGEFNPLSNFFELENGSISEANLEQVRVILLQSAERLSALFGQISNQTQPVEQLQARLFSNLHLRIYKERLVPRTVIQKIQLRWQQAQEASQRLLCQPDSWGRKLQFKLFSCLFFILPTLSVEMSQQQKTQSLGAFAIFTALLASLGLAASIVPKQKKRGLWQRIKRIFSPQRDKKDPLGCSELCGDCCEVAEDCGYLLLILIGLGLLIAIGFALATGGNYNALWIYLGVIGGAALVGLLIWAVKAAKEKAEYEAYKKQQETKERRKAEWAAAEEKLRIERIAASEEWLKENAKKPNVGYLSDRVQYEIIKEGDKNQPLANPKGLRQRPNGNTVIKIRRLGYDLNAASPETALSPIHSLQEGYIKDAALKLRYKGEKIRIHIPPRGDFDRDGRIFFIEIEALDTTQPKVLTSPSGLHYEILSEGDPNVPYANHIIHYKKDCSLSKEELRTDLRAPSWFKEGSFEYEGLQIMKNTKAHYRFFRPDSDFYRADFEIFISNSKAD